MRVLVIDNLVSGLRAGAIHDFARNFLRDGDDLCIRSTDGTTPIAHMLTNATDFDLVVASGGDGTISSVCNELRNSGVPVLPFPAGSANLIAANLDIPDEPSALARIARDMHTEKYDIGQICYEKNGERLTNGFAVIAGAGYDATIMRRAEKLKDPFGPMAYVAAAVSEPNPTVAHFTLTLDDEVLEMDGIAVLVINFAEIFPDFSITHGNDATDGLFEVVIIKKQHTLELLPALFAAFLDSVGNFPGRADAIEVRRSSKVHVQADPTLEIQYDGEAVGAHTPFEAFIVPGAINFVKSLHI
ncbi:MAG: NAD(+)/NADH kinase [Coriobacteriales bacterium]|jgi:diacylglycerol kinase family enzyme|nr:NAD(+)/NADH kinase [Coriobacteriales bacterium]